MGTERRNRRWAYVQGKRVQQKELRAQASVDSAVLVIGGERQAGLGTLRNPDLAQALRHLQARVHQTALASRPQPPSAVQHQPAVPPAPDLTAVRRRLERRQAEIKALEDEIQALALPGDQELQAALTLVAKLSANCRARLEKLSGWPGSADTKEKRPLPPPELRLDCS